MRTLPLLLLLSSAALAQGYSPERPVTSRQVLSYVQDAGTLADSRHDLLVNTVVAQATAPDGGVGEYGYKCEQNPCKMKLSAGTQSELVSSSNVLTFNYGSVVLPTTTFTALGCPTGSSCYILSGAPNTGQWVRLFPTTDATGCAAGTAGGIRYRSDLGVAGALATCGSNGTITQVATIISNTASVDFPTTASNGYSTATLTLSGALTTDVPSCAFTGTPEAGLMLADKQVTAADTITLTAHTPSGGGLDPAAVNVKCQIVR